MKPGLVTTGLSHLSTVIITGLDNFYNQLIFIFMVLTVTLNPLLEKRYSCITVSPGKNHRDCKLELNAGGKGINVSRQLGLFGSDTLAYTFIGGANGKVFNDIVHAENIKLKAVKTKSDTREAAVIINESLGDVTTFFEPSKGVSETEAAEFLSKLEKMILNCEMVVLSGSSPSPATDKIFPAAIEMVNRFDKVSICDTYGSHLKACIEAGPTILHNNFNEIRNSASVSLENEQEITDCLDYLYSKNIKQAYLTDGANPVYCSNFNFHFKVSLPVIKEKDPTGSGDAFVSGIAYGWLQDMTFEDTLSFAVSCGALNAGSLDVCRVALNDIESLRKDVVISPIGKKMKIVDVTPR
jgi:tagatose 6-phosphate kinase